MEIEKDRYITKPGVGVRAELENTSSNRRGNNKDDTR